MRDDLADITLVVDRSGSMTSCLVEAQGGINAFIKDQQSKPGDALFSLMQFDTVHEWVYTSSPIKTVNEYTLHPRGMTALLDSVGTTINETGKRLESVSEDQRPGLVIVAIITDGQENSSHEFTKAKIKEMIEHQSSQYNWQFTFLGADQDAFAEAQAIGIHAAATMNYDKSKSFATYTCLSASVGRMREEKTKGGVVVNAYTDEERQTVGK